MNKERFECFVDEWDEYNWYVKDNKNNEQLEYLEDVTKLLNQQAQRIAELEEQLKNARKETAKKVIDRVKELGVFDFEAYEEMDFRRYIIAEMALDNILKEYGE